MAEKMSDKDWIITTRLQKLKFEGDTSIKSYIAWLAGLGAILAALITIALKVIPGPNEIVFLNNFSSCLFSEYFHIFELIGLIIILLLYIWKKKKDDFSDSVSKNYEKLVEDIINKRVAKIR